MKPIVVAFWICGLAMGCQSLQKEKEPATSSEQGNESANEIALQWLHEFLFLSGGLENAQKVTKEGDYILIDSNFRIKVDVVPEFNGPDQGQWFYSAEFRTTIESRDTSLLPSGSVGIGNTAKEAFETAVQEWVIGFGTPLRELLFNQGLVQSRGKMMISSGPLAIRGNASREWGEKRGAMDSLLIDLVAGSVQDGAKSGISIVIVQLEIGKKGPVGGECRINGHASPELLSALTSLDWPPSNQSFMYKQIYLLTPR